MKITRKTRLAVLFLILNIALIFNLASCGEKLPSDLLKYQNNPFKLTGTLEYGDKTYEMDFETEGKGSSGEITSAKMTFHSPDALKGGVLNITRDEISFTVSGVRIPITEGTLSGVAKLPEFFALSASDFTERTEQTQNGMSLTVAKFNNESGEIAVYINNKTGYPVRIEMTLPKVNEVSDGNAVLSITKFENIAVDGTQTTNE